MSKPTDTKWLDKALADYLQHREKLDELRLFEYARAKIPTPGCPCASCAMAPWGTP